MKEGLKRTTRWAAHYFTNKRSYYPVPSNSIRFWNIPFLPPLPTVQMNDENQEYMREWARNNGKSVRQRTVRQETTKYKAGTLPLNMYERTQPIGENQLDEYSDGTDSSDVEVNIDEEIENDLSFLKTTRSGRGITINRSLF